MTPLEQRKAELLERRAKLQELLELQRECYRLEIKVLNRGVNSETAAHGIEIIANFFAIEVGVLLSRDRSRSVADARMWLYLLLFDQYRMSFSEIGRALDRDHAAVAHGISVIRGRIERDAREKETWKLIADRVAVKIIEASSIAMGEPKGNGGLNVQNGSRLAAGC